MRISDWSSDVCSSDLLAAAGVGRVGVIDRAPVVLGEHAHARQLVDAGVDGGIVVISFLALELFRAERHVVVEVEVVRSEEHTSELQSLMRISYAVFCLKKKKNNMSRKQTTIRMVTSTSR